MLADWPLDPAISYLNHGTVGVTPHRVRAVQDAIRTETERGPAAFLFRDVRHETGRPMSERPRMRAVAEELGQRLGARSDDLAWVDNATTGVNAVLRSIDWRAGDEVLLTDHGYGAFTLAARAITERYGAVVREVALPDPATRPGPIADAIVAAVGPRTRMVIVDHVTSPSALILPVAEIVARCRAKGAAVFVDGAHVPGALALDVASIGADWYTGNLHKWALAPRSCGFLWAPARRQEGLHPPVISWNLGRGFALEFDLQGTRDPSPWLAAPEGFRFLESLGIDEVRARNHALAWHAAHLVAKAVGTSFDVEESMVGCMATLPLPASFGSTPADADRLRDALLYEHHFEVPALALVGRLWLRLCAQVYNEESEYVRLGEVLKNLA
jgi:isopenicillin-N epimerase